MGDVAVAVTSVLAMLRKLTEPEREMLIDRLCTHSGRRVELTSEGLRACSEAELSLISSVVSGYVLVKENVPDIVEAYARHEGVELPQRVGFGKLGAK